jgi:hypothetical protein
MNASGNTRSNTCQVIPISGEPPYEDGSPDFVVFCQLKFWHLIISSLENIFLAIWVTQGFFVPLQHVRAKEEKPFWVCQRSGC